MAIDEATRARLEVVGSVLWRALVVGMALLLASFLMFLCCKGLAARVHGALFGVTEDQVTLMWYGFMALMKVALFVFFFCPYVAIRWVLATTEGGV